MRECGILPVADNSTSGGGIVGMVGRIRRCAGIACDNPTLVEWYLRNKLRVATVGFERRHMDGRSRFARGITFRLTSTCNLACKMCRFAVNGEIHTELRQCLPLETWKAVVDDVAPFSPYVTLTGGEPLVYPRIGELITHIRQRKMHCTLTTNGTLLAKRLADFADNPPDLLIVSIDGPAELHDEIRGQAGAFERAAEGIRAVQESRRERRTSVPLIIINSAVTSYSYTRVEEMLEIAEELGVDAINFQHQWSMTQRMIDEHNALYGGHYRISAEEMGVSNPEPVELDRMVEVVSRIRLRERDSARPLVTMHPELTDEEVRQWYTDPHIWVRRKPAICAWMNTEISPNGEVEPCFGYVVGNIVQTPLTQMWNDTPYRQLRRRLRDAEDFPICSRCCAFFRRD